MKKIIIAKYVRVSSDEQAKEGHSLSFQEERIDQHFAQKYPDKNYELRLYKDEGYSGASFDRPDFQRLLVDIELGNIDILSCWKVDRLYRDVDLWRDLTNRLKKNKIAFVSVTEPNIDLVSENEETNLQTGILSLFSAYERAKIRARVVAGKIKSMQMGHWNGDAPYGYKKENKKLVIEPEQAEWVKKMFKWVIEEDLSLRKVAKRLNEYGILTGATRRYKIPQKWSPITARTVLRNDVYTGLTVQLKAHPKEEQIPYKCEPIISIEDFNYVQKKLNFHRSELRVKSIHNFLFQRVLRCAKCRKKFFGSARNIAGGQTRVSYNTRSVKCVDENSHCGSIHESLLKKYVIPYLVPMCADPKVWCLMVEDNNYYQEIKKKVDTENTNILRINSQISRLEDAYIEGIISKEKCSEKKNELVKHLSDSKERLDEYKKFILQESEKDELKSRLIKHSLSLKNREGKEFMTGLLSMAMALVKGIYVDVQKKELQIELKIPDFNLDVDLAEPEPSLTGLIHDPYIKPALDQAYVVYQKSRAKRFQVVRPDKYHYSWCASANKIKPENQLWFNSDKEAEATGYTLAGNCVK